MASSIKNVILLGATGNIGVPILEALLAAKAFNVSVAVRSSSKTSRSFPANVTVHYVNYDEPSTLSPAFKDQDAIVSAVTTFATSQQKAIIDAAVAAGVKRFIPSEYGIDTSKPVAEELIPAVKMKRDTVAYLKEQESKGLSWTALCIGSFFDWFFHVGLSGFDFKTKTAQIYGDENAYFEASNVSRIAEAVVKILQHPEPTKNQHVYVHSFRVTQAQVLKAVEAATGEKWSTTPVDLPTLYKTGRERSSDTELNDGVTMVIVAVLRGYGGEHKLHDFGQKTGYWGEVLGLEDEKLDECVERIVKEVGGKA